MQLTFAIVLGFAVGLVLAGTAPLAAQETNLARTYPARSDAVSTRVLVKLRAPRTKDDSGTVGDKVAALAARIGANVRSRRELGSVLHVLEFDSAAGAELELQRLRADAEVEYAEPDRRRYLHALPSDPKFAGQWYLRSDVATPSAIDAERAWDLTTGSPGVVIAVLDTGVRFDHPDLGRAEQGGRLLPGYDFIANAAVANDGDGRDADPSDAGDYVTQADLGTAQFRDCDASSSSWHGTRVAGIVGARTDNGEGIAGATWSSWILPVRVLGKCGGFDSDILAAMLWASGMHIDGVPDNPYPAKVANLSLGGPESCSLAYTDVIATLAARGTLVVVSAGNEGGPVGSPANCANAVAVAGLRHAGTKVGYSSLGPEIALGAPAGNCVNLVGACLFAIDTVLNFGSTVPQGHGYSDQLDYNIGTSFSAPVVAAIAGLMASANGNLSAVQLRERLREGASKPFPVSSDPTVPLCRVPAGPNDVQSSECTCTTATCGAGMANALGAVRAALRPIAAVAVPAVVSAGQDVLLSATGSAAACGRNVASYEWSIVAGSGLVTGNPTPGSAVVVAPATGAFTVRVTVTDDAGDRDSADVEVTSSAASTAAPRSAGVAACLGALAAPAPPAPPAPPRSGGGGGAAGGLEVAALLLALASARRRSAAAEWARRLRILRTGRGRRVHIM